MLTNLADSIIGRVGADLLAKLIPESLQAGETAATFRLDKLSSNQITAIIKAILENQDLCARVDLKIPEALVPNKEDLPPEVLTPHNAGYIRNNVETDKIAVLTANGNEYDLADTLEHVMAIGAKEMRSDPELWAEAAIHEGKLALSEEESAVFQAALGGLLATDVLSLTQIGNFCAAVVEEKSTQGQAVRIAIGHALPHVGIPRHDAYFSSAKKFAATRGPWQKAFATLFKQRAPLLKKTRANGQTIDAEEIIERTNNNFEAISDGARQALMDFANAPEGDEASAMALAKFDWERDGVYLAFDKPKARQEGLAQATRFFLTFDCDGYSLTDEDTHLLDDLEKRQSSGNFTDDDERFFVRHRWLLERDAKLCARWEKSLYGKPVECTDFLEGFASVVNNLHAGLRNFDGERLLRITVSKGRTEWRERFNYDAGCFFSAMYRGLKELMGTRVDWQVTRMTKANLPDPLFDFERYFWAEIELDRHNAQKHKPRNIKRQISTSRQAMQIKFDVELLKVSGDDGVKLAKTQLLWIYKPATIGLSLVADMRRLLGKGAVGCTEVHRRLVSKKGGMQTVSLLDTGTLEATYGKNAGTLVPSTKELRSLSAEIKEQVNALAEDGHLTPDQRCAIDLAWNRFEKDYAEAMLAFVEGGLQSEAVIRQADSFGALLTTLSEHARNETCRSRLVSKVLSVGTTRVTGGNPALIIPPWHPERMKALAVKTRRVASFASHLLTSTSVLYGDREIFMRELRDELAHPFYPEIAALNCDGTPVLVAESSTVNGYSLLEAPIRGIGDSMTDVDSTSAAKQTRELLKRYVELQPHEASNLSVVLYNADAAELPLATVRELASFQEDDGIQCCVSVRHSDAEKLGNVYRELVNKAGDDPDFPAVSETSDNFIAKLRISVTPTSATPSKSARGFKAFDVAFLHDVVARSAKLNWLPVPFTKVQSDVEHAPSRWSYRCVSGENDLSATMFLTCPWQTASGWAYTSAVADVFCHQQGNASRDTRYLPVRSISLQEAKLSAMINDAHNLAEWVATYDELLDKRQLQHNKITVVRYRRNSTNGRNMIVSSTSDLRLLGVLVRRRLEELGLQIDAHGIQKTADQAKRDALSISGNIVLRAAKRGVSAGEMLGLVLSRYLLAEEFSASAGSGQNLHVYFLLDDYATWLSQPESRIADILALNVEETDGNIRVIISIVESKYVDITNLAKARQDSAEQLLATLGIFKEALFGAPGRLDRDVWLSRLADMLLDADIQPGMTSLMERARVKIREGDVEISLRGYSQVYVHTSGDGTSSVSEQKLLTGEDEIHAWQEVFDRTDLRKLVEAYACEGGCLDIRAGIGSHRPWREHVFRKPAPQVPWLAVAERKQAVSAPKEAVGDSLLDAKAPSATTATEQQAPLVPKTKEVPVATRSCERAAPSSLTEVGPALSNLIAAKCAGSAQSDAEREEWAQDVTRRFKTALNSYGLQAKDLGTRLTPNGCLIRFAGSDRLRVEDIENKRTQLLTTHKICLVTVQPKPGEIVVTVAGEKRQAVSLWDLWAQREINRNVAGINTSFLLGVQEINGAPLYLNLGGEFGGLSTHEPHSLVAGATGSGKSVLIQSLLLDIAVTNTKDQAQILLIDPKMGVDYAPLADLPHMQGEIITDKEQAKEALDALVQEMESRYRAFAQTRTRDLPSYNAKVAPEDRKPMLFLVHDEFADWMLDDAYKSEVGASVQRLGVKARAAGIHLIFAAQRPDKDVMPMQLRENLGNRLILKVSSEATSKIALDRPGAELLLGRGHLAAKLTGEQGLIFAQAPFLSDQDIEAAVAAIRADNEGA